MKIKVSIETNQLSDHTKEEMWKVYQPYYHYSKEYFMARIQKNDYYSFYRADGKIIGFTGLRVSRATVGGKKQLLVYFGQTVVHEDYRGKSLIPITGAKLCLKFWKELLTSKLYFWADSLTYKAYLVFTKTVEEVYPSCRYGMTSEAKALINQIGATYYTDTYCEATGTVQKDTVWVNDTTMQIPQKYQADEDIQFYLQANPLFMEGHGLLTITPMNRRNIGMLLNRYMRKFLGWKPKRSKTKTRKSAVLSRTTHLV